MLFFISFLLNSKTKYCKIYQSHKKRDEGIRQLRSDMIDYLCNIEGIAQDDVYVIGDSLNDKKMIEKYRGATLYSALSGVQAIASSTHPSVSVYVKKILKNQNNRK